jgi:hypothetical protein
MGVDAEMFVRVKRAVSDDEVRSLRFALGGAFGASRFWVFHRSDDAAPIDANPLRYSGVGPQNRHLLERVAVYEQDGPDIVPETGETFLQVYPATRFYGIGYERGDLPFLLSLARFLRDITGGEVWYGGDSSGECAQPLTSEYEATLWKHFVTTQHTLYERPFGGEGITPPKCGFCGGHPMRPHGCGSVIPYVCRGCGNRVQTKDRGATFHKTPENEFQESP